MGGARIDLETRTAIAKAVRKGTQRSVVARKFNVSQSAVARIGQAAGIVRPPLSIGQKKSQRTAIEAVKLESRRRRAELGLALINDAARLREQLWKPWVAYDFGGGGENYGYHEHLLKQPDARAQQAIAIAMAICVDKHLAIERADLESNTGTVKGAIVSLIDRLEAQELTTQIHVVDS